MSATDLWSHMGGFFRSYRPPSERMILELDPILVAYRVDAAKVLVTNRHFKWLTTALGVFTNFDTFMEHVRPQPDAKKTTHQTVAVKWLPVLQKLKYWDLLEEASKIRMAYARFFIIPKVGSDGGRAIFDSAAFSRVCARPYPVNLPYVPNVLRLIGAWRHEAGYCWAADYRHWWYQNRITDERIRNFFVIECGQQAFRAKVYLMGHSWSAFSGHSCTLGICLGEWPQRWRHLIDWGSLMGDTPPAWILLKDGDEVVGVLMAYYDNIFVFSKWHELIFDIKEHIIKRSKFCGAVFKKSWCAVCLKKVKGEFCVECSRRGLSAELEVDPIGQECDFLGAVLRFNGEQWVWKHRDTSEWPTTIPTTGMRRTFAQFVGLLVWDMTIALETIADVEPALKVLRKVTKGIRCRQDWNVRVDILQEESERIREMFVKAKNRGEMSISEGEKHPLVGYVFLATDASKDRIAWVHLSTQKPEILPEMLKCVDYDHQVAMVAHIFYKELEAAMWAIEFFCEIYQHVAVYLALDNSAVYFVLRRLWSGVSVAADFVERIVDALKKSGNVLLPVLIPGVHNVADSPTRGEVFSFDRLRATWDALEAERIGGSKKLHSWQDKRPRDLMERIRVEEAPDEILDEQDAFAGIMDDEEEE